MQDVPIGSRDLAVFTARLHEAWVAELDSEPLSEDLDPGGPDRYEVHEREV